MMDGLFPVMKAAIDRFVLALLLAGPLFAGLVTNRYDAIRFAGEDSDGVKYVQAASNLLNGRGLVHTRHDASPPWGEIREPLRDWPPGYPILVAGVSRLTGLEPLTAALWVTRVSWAILPALFLLCLRGLLPDAWAAAVALLAAFSPGFLESGTVARTDPLFSVVVCLTLLCVRAFLARRGLAWLFAAAVLAGVSYNIRTVGLALIAAVPAALLSHALSRSGWNRPVAAARQLAVWTVGVLAAIGPLVLHNLSTFGNVQPYSLPPSTIGFVRNTRWLAFALVADITAKRDLGLWVAWNWLPLGITALAAIVLVIAFLRRATTPYATALLLYAGLSAALLVVGRSTYQWGDLINERYVAQFTWIALAVLIGALLDRSSGRGRLMVQGVLGIACLAAVLSRAAVVLSAGGDESIRVAADERLRAELREWAARGDITVSDSGPLLSLLGDTNVRKIYGERKGACPERFDGKLSSLAADRALANVTLRAVILATGPCLDADLRALAPSWTVGRAADAYVVLVAPAPR
jgi:hypothetical protein